MSDAEGYETWTIAELKGALRELPLPVSGSKAELVARLVEYDKDVEEEAEEVEAIEKEELYGDSPIAAVLNRIADLLEPFAGIAEQLAAQMQTDEEKSPTAPTLVPASPPEPDESDTLRAHVKDATKRLLTAQPDGRSRAKSVLAEFGGSVSKVDADDLGACLQALQNHLDELGV